MGSPLRCHRFLWCHQSNHHPSLQKVLQTPHQKLHLKVRLVHDGDVSLCFCLSFPNEYWTKSFAYCEYRTQSFAYCEYWTTAVKFSFTYVNIGQLSFASCEYWTTAVKLSFTYVNIG